MVTLRLLLFVCFGSLTLCHAIVIHVALISLRCRVLFSDVDPVPGKVQCSMQLTRGVIEVFSLL